MQKITDTMSRKKGKYPTKPAPGWVGGFAESNPDFTKKPAVLTSLPMLDNMANIDLLQRQQKVIWPEFSWQTIIGDEDSRCFQRFAHDISRLGYTNEGRVYSIICPQQGACAPGLGCFNVEVTVTGQRGWVKEPEKDLCADMTVTGTIWFSPTAHENTLVKLLAKILQDAGHKFPFTKKDAIKVTTHKVGDPEHAAFRLTPGETPRFKSPKFAKHFNKKDKAWNVAHLEVEIGPIEKTGVEMVDDFNQIMLDVFNLAKGNMLGQGNTLTWNVWFTAPELVNQKEWKDHAVKWRESIDADHGSPGGGGTAPRHFDGSDFKPVENIFEEELYRVYEFIKKHI